MAKVKDNVLVKGFSGTIGRELTFRQIGGETFVSKYQKAPTVPATEKKLAVQTKFGMATSYAKRAIKDPKVKAMYQAAVKGGQRAFNIAMMDALQAPVVESIKTDSYHGLVSDPIIIHATDDFKVASVVVYIYNLSAELVEQGNAIQNAKDETEWLYSAKLENPVYSGSTITIVATDLPGNMASLSIKLSQR